MKRRTYKKIIKKIRSMSKEDFDKLVEESKINYESKDPVVLAPYSCCWQVTNGEYFNGFLNEGEK